MNSPDPSPQNPRDDDVPEPVLRPRGRWLPSLVWMLPLIAALVGVSLVVQTFFQRGPTITISFKTAEGLEPGKTKVKFKDVDIGEVKKITLSKDLSRVLVGVELSKDADNFAVAGTRFWVVRPRVAASGVSGLNTLLSGAYIGVDAGSSQDTRTEFIGLETPPAVTRDQKGHQYLLRADNLGSLDIGAPIFYRRVQVGQVVAYTLDPDGKGVTLRVFVNAPYDNFVGRNTRFWHASGVDLRLDSSGLKLNTQSLAAVVLGGIAFQSPPGEPVGPHASDDAQFRLAYDEGEAMKSPDGEPVIVVMNFKQSLRGLAIGAPVDFRGITLGQVMAIGIHYNPRARDFVMPVTVRLYPDRLGARFNSDLASRGESEREKLVEGLIDHGLRAQLRTGNLITSQLYVALDFFPKAPHVEIDAGKKPLELPTVPTALDQLQNQVADIARKLDKVPFDEIGNNLNATLRSTNSLIKQLNTEVAPEARNTLAAARKTFDTAQHTLQANSPLQSEVRQAMQELTRTAQSLNVLAEYLEQHPEALLRGKRPDQGEQK